MSKITYNNSNAFKNRISNKNNNHIFNNIKKEECIDIYENIKNKKTIYNPNTGRKLNYDSPITQKILQECYKKYKMKKLPDVIDPRNLFGNKTPPALSPKSPPGAKTNKPKTPPKQPSPPGAKVKKQSSPDSILPKKYVLLDWIDTDKLNWDRLSTNPNAIDLLEDRIKYEKTLTQERYNNLKNKINWYNLSSNPNAIDLLKERIKYEKTLTIEQYNNLDLFEKIDCNSLSANPNAIDLLKENKDKINWKYLSANPAIFKAV